MNDIVDSDERRENRVKAVFILGQIGLAVGNVSEYVDLLFSVKINLLIHKGIQKSLQEFVNYSNQGKENGMVFILIL